MIEFVIGGRPPSTRGRWDEKAMEHNKGRKAAGRAGGRRADSDRPCSYVAGWAVPTEGIPRGLLHEGAGAGASEYLRA